MVVSWVLKVTCESRDLDFTWGRTQPSHYLTNASWSASTDTRLSSVFVHLSACEPRCQVHLFRNSRSNSSHSDKIKAYSTPSPLTATTHSCQTRPGEQTKTAHSGTWNASANRAVLTPAPGTLCTYCRQPLATWEFRRTYGTLSLGNSLCQNLNKLRLKPEETISCLPSLPPVKTHTHIHTSHTNAY